MRPAIRHLLMRSAEAFTVLSLIGCVASRRTFLGLHGPVGPAWTVGGGIDRGELTVGGYRVMPPDRPDPWEAFALPSAGPPLADQLSHAVGGFGWSWGQPVGNLGLTAVDVPLWFTAATGAAAGLWLRQRRRRPDPASSGRTGSGDE